MLQSHDDVPDDLREQLYREEQQDLEHQRKRRAPSLASYPPINITNVLPGQVSAGYSTLESTEVEPLRHFVHLQIPGPRDVAVKRYSDWQCSQVTDRTLKMEYKKACDLTLADGLDLELVFEDQDAEFYVEKGVKRGVARRFVRDIENWAKEHMGV